MARFGLSGSHYGLGGDGFFNVLIPQQLRYRFVDHAVPAMCRSLAAWTRR
jgi:hypothetical protein